MQDQSDNYHTYDGVGITPGLRVWSPYTMSWGTVEDDNWTSRGELTGPGGKYFDGWYYVRSDDGRSDLLNGTRFATVDMVTHSKDPKAT
jgi:hypothetical protein